MVLMKRPAAPIRWNNGNFGPKGYYPYFVMTGDNWENIALRDGRTHVWDLIRDNFQTDDPEEVNWYLQNFVGCTVSKDGKNYSFSSTDAVKMSDGTKRRGRIFTQNDLRAVPPPPPPDDHDQLRKAMLDAISIHSGTIFGIGFSMCGFDLYGSNYRVIRDYLKDRKGPLCSGVAPRLGYDVCEKNNEPLDDPVIRTHVGCIAARIHHDTSRFLMAWARSIDGRKVNSAREAHPNISRRRERSFRGPPFQSTGYQALFYNPLRGGERADANMRTHRTNRA